MYNTAQPLLINVSISATCAAPTIASGTVSPLDDSVNYGESYAVTCNDGYTISGSPTMTCSADGAFDQSPTCLESKNLTNYNKYYSQLLYLYIHT